MGAREPRASPLRPRPPPGSPELGGRGGRGRPRLPRTPVEPKDTARGRGDAPRTYPRRGSGASGGRRPGHAERPEGQVSRWRRPGGGVRAKVPRRRRARPTRGGPRTARGWRGWGQRRPTRRGWGTAPSGVGGSRPGKGRTPDQTGLRGDTAPPGGRGDPAREGVPALAARRWGQC